MSITDCKRFNGYKPCFPGHNCLEDGCKDHVPMGKKILIINLDAMGDVIMTTAQLHGLKRKYPESTIYWVTLKICSSLLLNNPLIDKVFNYDFETISILETFEFDLAVNLDKSLRAAALLTKMKSKKKMGFGLNNGGKIVPMNKGAEYNYILGMDDNLKFKVNKKTKQEYVAETFEIDYLRDEYVFDFTDEEKEYIVKYKNDNNISDSDFVVGINTGCSELFSNKKLTLEQHEILIEKLLKYKDLKVVLVGGPEDKERNAHLEAKFSGLLLNTPTNDGVRRGACYEQLCDVLITGDSFGMHLAIALKKYIIVWFGLSCWTEIDLYDRGVMLTPDGLDCAPCWKRSCPKNLECRSMVDLDRMVKETLLFFNKNKGASFKI